MEKRAGWRRRRIKRDRAVMRCVSDAFSDGMFRPPRQSITITMGARRRGQRRRKSRSDNYNAGDKIMGARLVRPIIPCINC